MNGRYALEDTIYDLPAAAPAAPAAPDCTAWPEQAKVQIATLEARIKALEGVISHHADALTVILLREGL